MSARELFVYYRIAVAEAGRCRAVVLDFQDRLRGEEHGLRTRLLARPIATDGEETWMETYAIDGPSRDGIDAALEARIEAAAAPLAPHLRGGRHVEVFIARD